MPRYPAVLQPGGPKSRPLCSQDECGSHPCGVPQPFPHLPWPAPDWRQAHHAPGRRRPAGPPSCGLLPNPQHGGSAPAWHPSHAHPPLPAGGAPLRMALASLGAHRLPVQTRGRLHRRLPACRAAARQGASVRVMGQPLAPPHPRLRRRDMQQPPLQNVRHRQGEALGGGTGASRRFLAGPTGAGHAGAIAGHQPGVLAGAAAPRAAQGRAHPSPRAIALPDVHGPFRLPGRAEASEEGQPLLRPAALGPPQGLTRQSLTARGQPLPPHHRHAPPDWEEEALAHRLPGPVCGPPTPGDQAVHGGGAAPASDSRRAGQRCAPAGRPATWGPPARGPASHVRPATRGGSSRGHGPATAA
jgi:hypothetical protein